MEINGFFIVFSNPEDGVYQLDIRNLLTGVSSDTFEYESDIAADEGDLMRVENNVVILPHGKMLNYIEGTWYLNDIRSTVPVIAVEVTEIAPDSNTEGTEATSIDNPLTITDGTEYATEFYSETNAFILVNQVKTITVEFDYGEDLTPEEVRDTIVDALNADLVFSADYTAIALDEDGEFKMYVEANQPGDEYNGTWQLGDEYDVIYFDYEPSDGEGVIEGGTDPEDVFSNFNVLEPDTDYWYKARLIYEDGHKTKTCFPRYVRTTDSERKAILTIKIPNDLKGTDTYPDVEIYRRKEDQEFKLITRQTLTSGDVTLIS